MTTSVIIPVWNGLEMLKANLPAVIKARPTEIIIVDDASPDDSAAFVRKNFPQIKIIRHSQNTRFPQAVNDGVAAAKSDIVVLLNQDVCPRPDFLKPVLQHFQDPQVFAVTFNEQEHSWAKAEIRSGFVEFENGPKDGKVHESFWANGGSSAIRRDLWNQLGGFDAIFSPGYFEDFDLSWRARNRGFKVLWDPQSQVTHATESTNRSAFAPAYLRRRKERNYLLAHWKNLPLSQMPLHLLVLLGRILHHPGYIIPVALAAYYSPHIIAFRLRKI